MSSEKWGKDTIVKTWQFVLECWFTRNKFEHDNENNPVLRLKEKLIEHIMWVVKNNPTKVKHPYKGIAKETMITLPLDNLTMMLKQVKTVIPQIEKITN
jgi:hypothetical protein